MNLRWDQILTLIHILSSSSSTDVGVIQRWYETKSLNFHETLDLLRDIEIILINNGQIKLTNSIKANSSNEELRDLFINSFFKNKKIITKYLGNFLNLFVENNSLYEFLPSLRERLTYSDERNFLISLDLLVLDENSNKYISSKELAFYIESLNQIYSPRALKERIKHEEELGLAAELFVLEIEKQKHIKQPKILKKIIHVSQINTMAGYDIKSFQIVRNKLITKYIEVKAVSPNEFKFYWSRNEIEKSKQLKENYYLYLVPVTSSNKFNSSEIKQIKDPYQEIVKNKKGWIQVVELMSFFPSLL